MSDEPQANNIYVFDAKAHGHILAENARLETELALEKEAARKVQAYNEEIIGNVRAQLVEARERIKEMEADEAIKIVLEENARLKEQVAASTGNTSSAIDNTHAAMEQWTKALKEKEQLEKQLESSLWRERHNQTAHDIQERRMKKQLTFWQGKFHALRHENNKLRKRAQKLAATEEALAQIQQESAALREAKEHIQHDNQTAFDQLRAVFPHRPSGITSLTRLAIAARDGIANLNAERDKLRDVNTNVFIELAKAFHDLPDSPIPIIEIAIRARDEISSLRAERDKLQERSNILLRQIDIKRDELRRADQDHIALQQEQNAAMRALMEAKPPSTTAITGLAQYACQVRDCMAELRQRLERAEQSDQNNNIAYTILREAFPKQPRRVGLNTLIVLARAAVEHIQELKRELHKTTRRAERAEHHWSETERRLAAAKERAKTGRLHAMQTNNRLREELKAAQKVVETADAWEKAEAAIVEDRTRNSRELREEEGDRRITIRDAVRAYRKQTNNQQPQGEQFMPIAPYTEIDAEMRKHLAQQSPEEKSQTDLDAEMKRRLAGILEERPATAERMASDDGDTRSQNAPSCAQVDQEGPSKPDPAPLPTPGTGGGSQTTPETTPAGALLAELAERIVNEQRITPKTAPVGARILVKRRGARHEDPVEITVHEWAPSGKRVLFYDRYGRQFWDEDLPARGILVETLPPSPERQIARAMAKDLMEHLMGVGAERGRPADLDTLLKDKPGAATTLDRLDELAAQNEAQR